MAQLAPDWWMRGVTRPGRRNAPLRDLSGNASKGGGAKNGAEKRAQPRATKGADEEDSCHLLVPVGRLVPGECLVPFVPGELVVPTEPSILARALESLERARSRCSSERGDSAEQTPSVPQNPVRAVEQTTRAARGTSSRITPEELGVAVTREGLDTQGKSRLPFLLGFV